MPWCGRCHTHHIADVGKMVDLDATIAQCIKYAKRDWKEGAWGYNEAEIVVDTVRLLAPRIVREGMVVVPKEPTDEMVKAGEELEYFEGGYGNSCTQFYKAMIAASKGD